MRQAGHCSKRRTLNLHFRRGALSDLKRRSMLGLLAALAAYTPSGTFAKGRTPVQILADMPWSFKEPTPKTLLDFVVALRDYSRDVGVPFQESLLHVRLPVSSMDVRYAYTVRASSGDWQYVEGLVRIRQSSPPSHAELLYYVHSKVHEKLVDQDHCFFEGFHLLEAELEEGVPAYEMYLGS